MSQSKSHFLRFLVYDQDDSPFWAIVAIANFRGEGDEENMTLGNVSGTTGRTKPKELFGHLEGLVSTQPAPTKGAPPSKPKEAMNSAPQTQELMRELLVSTQVGTPKATRPTTPDSGGSKSSRPTMGGKAPRQQPATQTFGDKQIELTDSSAEENEEGSDEDELQSFQPESTTSSQPQPKQGKPRTTLVQTSLAGGLASNKRAKLAQVPTTDTDEATTLKFSGSNVNLVEMNKMVENMFMAHVAQKEAEEESAPKKTGKKGKGKSATDPKFTKAGKASSAASTEQKGRPLFMKCPFTFLCSKLG